MEKAVEVYLLAAEVSVYNHPVLDRLKDHSGYSR